MKLYFFPGACCMSCHIALEEAKIPFDLVYVGKNADENTRASFLKVNPIGAVPALELDDGKVITQNIAILEYIADINPASNLLAPIGTYERADIMRWLSFVASDLHKSFSPLFRLEAISQDKTAQSDIQKWCLENIHKYLSLVEMHLKGKAFLSGEHFSIADAYFFTVYQWTKPLSISTEKYSEINRYINLISKKPSVVTILNRESAYR